MRNAPGQNLLYEILLLFASSVDGRALLLLLVAAWHSVCAANEGSAEGYHSKLGILEVSRMVDGRNISGRTWEAARDIRRGVRWAQIEWGWAIGWERIVHGVKERKRPMVGNEERWSRVWWGHTTCDPTCFPAMLYITTILAVVCDFEI
jgi:hypothetical protein